MRHENKKAEASILGGSLIDNARMSAAVSTLEPTDFTEPAHQVIYTVMRNMFIKGQKIDIISLEYELAMAGLLDQAGGGTYVNNLSDDAYPSMVSHHAQIVKRMSIARQIEEALICAQEEIRKTSGPDEVVEKLQGLLDKSIPLLDTRSHADEIADIFYNLEKIQAGEMEGYLPTGLPSLDEYAPSPGELVVVAARPSVGKSALALAISDNMTKRGKSVLFESIEMGQQTVAWRRWAMETGIDLNKFRRRESLSSEEWAQIAGAVDEQKKRNLYVVCNRPKLYHVTTDIRKYHQRHGLNAVVVDHLHLMHLPEAARRDLQLKTAVDVLTRMGKKLGVVVYLLCQLNRQVDSRQDTEPRLSDLRDSGAIEENADKVWLLHRADKFAKELKINVAKNRNGPVGKVELDYEPSTGRFNERRL